VRLRTSRFVRDEKSVHETFALLFSVGSVKTETNEEQVIGCGLRSHYCGGIRTSFCWKQEEEGVPAEVSAAGYFQCGREHDYCDGRESDQSIYDHTI
jgi:hypothetical protein